MRRALLLLVAACSHSTKPPTTVDDDAAVVCPDASPGKRVFWGDLHVHSSYSLDAYGWGTKNDPARAYAFAKGETITLAGGGHAKIDRPLDFSVVSDHSEYFDQDGECGDTSAPLYGSDYCKELRSTQTQVHSLLGYLVAISSLSPQPSLLCRQSPDECQRMQKSIWDREQAAARAANVACKFTAFNAYEWTDTVMGHQHRVIVFRGTKVPALPLDYLRYPSPLAMLSALERECQPPDCDALAIPHNSNLSEGHMFEFDPTTDETRLRAKFEKLVEVHQAKGASECLNAVDPSDSGYDPVCDFEIADPGADLRAQYRAGYAREALKQGLLISAAQKIDPLAFGFVGGTDTHNATPGNVKESGWPGHSGVAEGTALDRLTWDHTELSRNPGGLTGVWSEQNTRASLFAALARRETFATSGPRIVVRFFATFQDGDPCADPSFPAALVQAGAVPMGGLITTPPAGKLRLVVSALKDPEGVDLSQIQIVKATVAGGTVREQILDYTPPGPVESACHVFEDAEFDRNQPTFYYARVLEVPTARWSKLECDDPAASAEVVQKCQAEPALDAMIRERAWSSPIFSLP